MASGFSHRFISSVLEHALQQIFTNAFGCGGAWLEPVVALAAVAPDRVDAAPVLTDARFGAAFVQVCRNRMKRLKRWIEQLLGAAAAGFTHPCNPVHPACAASREGRCTRRNQSCSYKSYRWSHSRPALRSTRPDLHTERGNKNHVHEVNLRSELRSSREAAEGKPDGVSPLHMR